MKKLFLTFSFLFAVLLSFAQTQTVYSTLQSACDANAVGSTNPHANRRFYYYTNGDGKGFSVGRTLWLDTTKANNKKFDYKVTTSRIGYFQQQQKAFQVDKTGKVTSILACATPTTPADLVVTNVIMNPANPTAGQAVTFSATVKNQGGSTTSPTKTKIGVLFTIKDASGNPINYTWSDNDTTKLAAGATRTFTANGGVSGNTWAYASGNTYMATVNDGKLITESNYTNNSLDYNANSTVPAVNGIDLIVSSFSMNPATPAVGQAVTFSAVIKNIGNTATAKGVKLGVLFTIKDASGNPIGYTWSDTTKNTSLLPNKTITLTANGGNAGASWICSSPVTIEVNANDGKLINEASYTNNTLVTSYNNTSNGGGTTGNETVGTLTYVPSHPYTPTRIFGEIGWSKFPKFTPPADGQYYFRMAGAEQATANNSGATIFDYGWTHAGNWSGRTQKVFGNKDNNFVVNHTFSGIWTGNGIVGQFAKKNGYTGMLVESNINYNDVMNTDVGASNCATGEIDIEGADDDYLASDRMFDFRFRAAVGKKFSDGMRASGVTNPKLASYFREPYFTVNSDYFISNIQATCGTISGNRRTDICNNVYISKPYRFPNFDIQPDPAFIGQLGAGGSNYPADLATKSFIDIFNINFADYYPTGSEFLGNGNYITHFQNLTYQINVKYGFNGITSALQKNQIFRKNMPIKVFNATNKHSIAQVLWLRTEYHNHMSRIYQKIDGSSFRKVYAQPTDPAPAADEIMRLAYDDHANDFLVPDNFAKSLAVMIPMSGALGFGLWDYSDGNMGDLPISLKPPIFPLNPDATLTPQYQALGTNPRMEEWWQIQKNTNYSAVEAVICGLHQLFGDHNNSGNYNLKSMFFDNYCLYLNQDTEVDYLDGSGFKKYTTLEVEKKDYPQVLAVVNPATRGILIAGVYAYGGKNYQKTVKVRYNNVVFDLNITGNEPVVAFGKF